jgi:transposase-like protein
MTQRKRRNHSPEFKARIAIATLKGDKTLSELAAQYDVHPKQTAEWKMQLVGQQRYWHTPSSQAGPNTKTMEAKIGQLTL